jgi:uncharacterized protein HemX
VTATGGGSNKSGNTTAVAAGLGAVLGVMVLLGLGGGLWLWKQLQAERKRNASSASLPMIVAYEDRKRVEQANLVHEIPDSEPRFELQEQNGPGKRF